MGHFKRLSLLVAALVAACAMVPTASQAQIPLPDLPTSSPTPTASPTPKPRPTATSTPKPGGSGGGDEGGSTGGSGGGSGGSRPTGTTKKRAKKQPKRAPMPAAVAKALAEWRSRAKSPARTTTNLLNLIDANAGDGSATFQEQRRGFGRFPVVGYTWFQDDYGAPRFANFYNLHEGTDLFAVTGTPVSAVADGTIWKMVSTSDRGKSIYLLGNDGAYYFFGHLGRFAKGLSVGDRVRAGEPIGRIGTSADAQGTYPHVHFEIHPNGTPDTINPKPVLDSWLADAEANLSGALGALRTRTLLAPFGAAHWDTMFALFAERTQGPPALWASAFDGTGSTVAYADLALTDVLAAGMWETLTPTQPVDPLLRLLQLAHANEHGD